MYVCMYVYLFVCIGMHSVCIYIHVLVEARVSGKCLLPALVFETGSLTEPGAHWFG